jgi:hypothetical protein
MVEPRLTDGQKLTAKPAADHVHCGASAGELVQRRELLRRDRGVPRSGWQGDDEF